MKTDLQHTMSMPTVLEKESENFLEIMKKYWVKRRFGLVFVFSTGLLI